MLFKVAKGRHTNGSCELSLDTDATGPSAKVITISQIGPKSTACTCTSNDSETGVLFLGCERAILKVLTMKKTMTLVDFLLTVKTNP